MTYGIRIKNPDGSVALDTTTGMTFILGTVTTVAGINGSFTIPYSDLKQYFAYLTGSSTASGVDQYGSLMPQLEVNGRTVKWTYPNVSNKATLPTVTITYGGSSN